MRLPFLRSSLLRQAALCLALVLPASGHAQRSDTLRLTGLRLPVEVLRDAWGIAHIYAGNEHDLFFAQGYTAARDRAFQFEIWRRQATGTVAEVLGTREIARDRGARLFKYRGNLAADLAMYHPRGAAIVGAFVEGINAFVDEAAGNPELVPLELKLLGITPGRWTPDVVISRHQGLLGNITEELAYGRFVARHGADLLRKVEWFHPGPGQPALTLDPAIDTAGLFEPILDLYNAYRAPVRFLPSDVQSAYRGDERAGRRLAALQAADDSALDWNARRDIGSNNWVVSPRLTLSGRAIMANDPHRAQAAPSLRYFVHLVAPGWNVIGGGEPTVPGVSIGHNEYGAWGLTVFSTDGEDLYVYKTNPANRSMYRYRGAWEAMRTVRETIPVKGSGPETVTLKYTRHGPVVYEDTARGLAYAVRAAWMEPGGAPYMASLRMDQARTWEDFREACSYSNIPGENMIWADVKGNIGWQAVGIAPIRPASSGLVPVPGDGRFEWAGYLPIRQKPHAYNPAEGFIATANSNLTREDYPYRNAIGWSWADPFRFARIAEVLGSGQRSSLMDMMRLQNDYTSLPARALVPLLAGLTAPTAPAERARQALLAWDHVLDKDSVGAGIYEAWYRRLVDNTTGVVVPPSARTMARGISTKRIVEWLTAPGGEFGANPTLGRDSVLLRSLDEAVRELTQRYGADMTEWRWGRYHQVTLRHPMSAALNDELRQRFEVGPWPRGGDGNTPGATGGGENQTAGASFRLIVEAGDWDAAVGTNTPGQSGDVSSPHYRDLFELWKDDRYFPVKYTRPAVEAVTRTRWVLAPSF
ncbi:MAG: penicillin acylase family protein [Gemmatimonadaceae bacterium]|nr:penicillin acylase family protein [Gemmatimonadaceae bacterium]